MPAQTRGAQWASTEQDRQFAASGTLAATTRPRRSAVARVVGTLLGVIMVVSAQASIGAVPVAADSSSAPLAVFIVGPSAGMTNSNLADSAALARDADAAGMRVRKVFHPRATWENVLDAIQGASLVVYMGHGNGWPSPNGPFQEDTKNGFGLNPREGASGYSTAYYGADKLRKRVQLAKNAVVLLVHLCYASGNGEEYMGPEWDKDIATKRVDNFASGFLDIGARAVFAYGMDQKIDFPRALMNGDRTMDEIFKSPNSDGRYDGFVGVRDYYRDSRRTGWARIHMDPHPREGHFRSLTGDLAMTATDFRSGAGDAGGGGPTPPAPDTRAPVLKLNGSGTGLAAGTALRFSPNGDRSGESIRLRTTLSERATVRVEVRDRKDTLVRAYSRTVAKGRGSITWNGHNNAGKVVADGNYRVTLTPRDKAGNKGSSRSVNTLVLTTLKAPSQSRRTIFSADRDKLAQSTRVGFTLLRKARVTWVIRDSAGRSVATHIDGRFLSKGKHAWIWAGRDQKGRSVKAGTYHAVVTARTAAGTVRIMRTIRVGAFRIETSDATPGRGQRIRIRVFSTEPLKSAPRVRISQPGHADRIVTTKRVGAAYVATVELKSKGKAGALRIVALGTDARGGHQSQTRTLRIH